MNSHLIRFFINTFRMSSKIGLLRAQKGFISSSRTKWIIYRSFRFNQSVAVNRSSTKEDVLKLNNLDRRKRIEPILLDDLDDIPNERTRINLVNNIRRTPRKHCQTLGGNPLGQYEISLYCRKGNNRYCNK